MSSPHFADPEHSSSPDTLEDLIIDNHPITPTSKSDSLATLTAERPLSSAFLLSLARPASLIKVGEEKSRNTLPSEIPILRKEDLDRYLDSTSTEIQITWEGEGEVDEDASSRTGCGGFEFILPKGYRMRQKASYVVKEYSDVLVVGVVLLFLLTVVCVEAVEKFGSV
jgi:hypothetical protein